MRKPQIIALASIIPGLGFWLLGQHRRAAQAFIITLLGAVVAYAVHQATSIPLLQAASLGAFLIPWAVQAQWAANSAWQLSKRPQDPARQAKETDMDAVGGSSFSQGEKLLERVEDIAVQQLEAHETLLAVVPGSRTEVEETPQARIEHPYQMYYLALTETDLLIMEADWGGVPIAVDRIPRRQIEELHYFPGLTSGRLTLKITGKEQIEYQVGRAFLKEAQRLYDEINPSSQETPELPVKRNTVPSLPRSQEEQKPSRIEKARKWFAEAPIGKVQWAILGGAFTVFLLTVVVVNGFGYASIPEPWNWRLMGIMALIMGLSFVPGIIRREFYWSGERTLRGSLAVFLGVLFAIPIILAGLYFMIAGG